VAKAAEKFINHPKIKVSITKAGRLYFPTAIGLATIPFIIQVMSLIKLTPHWRVRVMFAAYSYALMHASSAY
jgi:hypothetical protein